MITTDMIKTLPPMKTGDTLLHDLEILPEYTKEIWKENTSIRLMKLSDLYSIYIPSFMSQEIYNKLYLALLRSLQKKSTKVTVMQQNQNFRAMQGLEHHGIIGGSDSFTIIGVSGIGKSSAISRAITLITEHKLIEVEETQSKIIPCVMVQCPFDSSVKGLLLNVLHKVDEEIGSNYYENAIRVRATVDMLIGNVSQVALNHIGLLIVDEIQNVCNSKQGKSLVGMLTQLINNSGISICMVGTPESAIFFESAMQLARRSLGLQYQAMEYNHDFQHICKVLYSYQYTKKHTEITDTMIEWLYEHSAGIVSVVVALIHDAQEIAILNGKEELNLESLNEAYQKRFSLLHGYLEPTIKKGKQTTNRRKATTTSTTISEVIENTVVKDSSISTDVLANLVKQSKKENLDIVKLLKENLTVVEVSI